MEKEIEYLVRFIGGTWGSGICAGNVIFDDAEASKESNPLEYIDKNLLRRSGDFRSIIDYQVSNMETNEAFAVIDDRTTVRTTVLTTKVIKNWGSEKSGDMWKDCMRE